MSYKEKYLKYKNKYIELKNQIGGDVIENIKTIISKLIPLLKTYFLVDNIEYIVWYNDTYNNLNIQKYDDYNISNYNNKISISVDDTKNLLTVITGDYKTTLPTNIIPPDWENIINILFTIINPPMDDNYIKYIDWFFNVFGFYERHYVSSSSSSRFDDFGPLPNDKNIYLVNQYRIFNFFKNDINKEKIGKFTTPNIQDILSILPKRDQKIGATFEEISFQDGEKHVKYKKGDTIKLIREKTLSEGCVFQAASQFNVLEMAGPSKIPNDGITIYETDKTQGPACAIACPYGTAYRNYLINVDQNGRLINSEISGRGQGEYQINTLKDILDEFKINDLVHMKNGYLFIYQYLDITNNDCTKYTLSTINTILKEESNQEILINKLRVGVQEDTTVYHQNKDDEFKVTQVYVSALPISYNYINCTDADWKLFAINILKGAYLLTLLTACKIAYNENRRVTVYLTRVGGGVFGNPQEWIDEAIKYAFDKTKEYPIDVKMIYYGDTPKSNISLEKIHNKKLWKITQTELDDNLSDDDIKMATYFFNKYENSDNTIRCKPDCFYLNYDDITFNNLKFSIIIKILQSKEMHFILYSHNEIVNIDPKTLYDYIYQQINITNINKTLSEPI